MATAGRRAAACPGPRPAAARGPGRARVATDRSRGLRPRAADAKMPRRALPCVTGSPGTSPQAFIRAAERALAQDALPPYVCPCEHTYAGAAVQHAQAEP